MKYLAPLALLILGGCSSRQPAAATTTPGPSPAPDLKRVTTIYERIPAKVGNYSLTERAAVRAAPKDSLYRFTDGSKANVTAFIYDVPPEVRVDADSQKWTMREGDRFRQVMEIRRQRGDFESYIVAFSDSARLDLGTQHKILEHSIATPVRFRTGETVIEFQFLYLIDGKFLKVRATVPTEGWERSTVPLFARALAGIAAKP